ncbi:MAG: glycosyltransferase family 2 protein [Candidatus Zixiibacteriota bacterium]
MSDPKQPFVSVVTPFYNTAPYLEECIKSVLAQTYQNWEYVLANNKSTDGSLEIAQKYAALDSRIRLSTNETFLDQVPNYNNALRQVSPKAEYIKMVQADDWMFPECLDRMVAVAASDPEIAIVSTYSLRGVYIGCQGLRYPSIVTPGIEALRLHLLEGISVLGTPTNLLYRADLVRERHTFFDEVSLLDDLEVCYEILPGRKLGFVHQLLVYVREDNPSISNKLLQYNPWPLHRIIMLRKHGKSLLTEEEFNSSFDALWRSYIKFLGYAKLRGRPKEFWDYQKKGFEAAGLTLGKGLLWVEAFGAAADIIFNPKQSWDRLLARLSRKQNGNS